MAKATCATPHTCKQSQYQRDRFVTTIGTLKRYTTLHNMLFKMAFLKHFEEQGETTKRCYFLFTNFMSQFRIGVYSFFVVKLVNIYESSIYEAIFLMTDLGLTAIL